MYHHESKPHVRPQPPCLFPATQDQFCEFVFCFWSEWTPIVSLACCTSSRSTGPVADNSQLNFFDLFLIGFRTNGVLAIAAKFNEQIHSNIGTIVREPPKKVTANETEAEQKKNQEKFELQRQYVLPLLGFCLFPTQCQLQIYLITTQ